MSSEINLKKKTKEVTANIQNAIGTKVADEEEVSLVDGVYNAILLKIINGELPSGTELKTTRLADELEVSRTPVIQALAYLTADGIVNQERNYRAIVRPGAENWLVEVHELRVLLEPYAAEQAASRITADALAALEQVSQNDAPVKSKNWISNARNFDYALHLAIAEHCGNLPIQQSIRKCWEYKQISYDFGSDTPEVILKGHEEHLSILEALKEHNPEMAKAAMQFHLQNASRHRSSDRIV